MGNRSYLVSCFLVMIFLSGCGGGASGSGGGTTTTGSFALSLSPASLNLVGGMNANVAILVTGQDGFSGLVTLTASGLPSGVTASPTSVSVSPGNSGQVTLTAASSVATGNSQITINGTSGSLSAKATLALSLTTAATPVARPFTTIGGGLVRGFYDETRKLLFATNPFLNELDVLSGENLAVTARVNIPQPFGIDQMPDGKTLVVGTLTQGIYTVDEDTLIVTPHLAPNFTTVGGSAGLSTTVLHLPVAMANGKVLLLGLDVGVELDYVYGGKYIVEWDSNTGIFTLFTYSDEPFFNLKRSADHKWAIFGGEAQQLYLYNSDSDAFTSSQAPVLAAPYGIRDVAANPNGTQFAVVSAYSVAFYDSAFNALGTFNFGDTGGFVFQEYGMQYSADGSKLYWELFGDTGGGSVVDAVDTAKFSDLGNVTTAFDQLQFPPNLLWVDSAQRAFESSEGGIGIFDCTVLRTGQPTANGTLPDPKSIPLDAPAPVSFGFASGNALPLGSVVTFGGQLAATQSVSPLVVQAPASSVAGPVDLVITQPDGETEVEPQEFSYGVDVAAATASLAPPIGNPTLVLFGFGMLNCDCAPPIGPASVTVGGTAALYAAINLDSVNALEAVAVQLPNGKPGPANIVVTGNNGTGTLKSAVTYIPSASIVPASGLVQLLYDGPRNLLYALKATEIDVLNPATLQWQSPLLPGSGKGYVSMTLTPDGSSMLVVDATANTLTIFNPDDPTQKSVTALPMQGQAATPIKVVATNTGKAFIGVHFDNPIEFDLTTLTATLLSSNLFGYTNTFAATPDGSHMVTAILNDSSGEVGVWSSSSDSFAVQWFIDGFWTDLAISPDGSRFTALRGNPTEAGIFAGFFDEQLHYLNEVVYPDLAPPDSPQSLGAMFSPSGQTLIVPMGDSIDFFSSSKGTLQGRLLTPEPLPIYVSSTGTIALDTTAKIIYAISASGLTVMTLPTTVDQILPPIWPYAARARHSVRSKTVTKKHAIPAGMHNSRDRKTDLP
jgi:hypothetical protein